MASNSQHLKKNLDDIRAVSEFKENYEQVTHEMLEAEHWTPEERETMHLLSEGDDPQSIRNQIQLDEESNKKIADIYFMILLNTLIRSKIPMPFKLPEKEITSWPDHYPRDRFASDLLKHKKELASTAVGREVMKAASEYTSLYESTVGHNPDKVDQKSDNKSSTFDRVCDSLGFLYGVADGLSFSAKSPLPGVLTMTSNSASAGYAVGMFAKGIFELGGVVATLMK
ncbi:MULTISPECIES: hypothetical protein [Legionella]|uniref:Dot/Icm secretion system substrate n=1 Tax=Legionella resiliens TaxID=2905958 RepID=A0ABS8WWJ0_9GAMM|nr:MULTISPECIES: hypothetical protein [unclassified Legionella]MCE0721689.1 hypothetical protein [Legionella sp. 9fVS26]MCE3530843.1 hypothetical protein [Legionella sp. 8cVS16]QLZ70404.1 hypothetical protein FOLKNPGA_03218 [Legionella sp. PC1000]